MSYSGGMSQLASDQESESGADLAERWYHEQQALPVHKRDGYAERMYEQADEARKAARENQLLGD